MRVLHVFLILVGLFVSVIAAVLSDLRQDEVTSRGKRSTESSSYVCYQQSEYPRDCKEVYDQCENSSAGGVYLIQPEGSFRPFEVYCNHSTDGGGWTVIQRRLDGSVEFFRDWHEYRNGFGFLRGEFWLGNDKISYLTNQKTYELRIDLKNVNGRPYFAKYNLFRISDEDSKYRLVGLGDYDSRSTANSDAMANSRNFSFTTPDRDNDHYSSDNCARNRHGAWWYNDCGVNARLNGLYNAGSSELKSIRWQGLHGDQYHLKYSEMKIRPLQNL